MTELLILVAIIIAGVFLGWLKWYIVYRPLLRSLEEALASDSRPQAIEPSKARYVSKIK